ncbi:MAG: 30S ribosomal protein S12 methylthiotransferase RimO, partial [Lentisphaeria bacterium]|nr:30S ribosomal protein S12 methylthiotransferase RimO [Lentisphaeria bacterium]
DRILKAMNRHVDSKRIVEVIEKLREAVPGVTIRTTFITGLPGESEEEFSQLEKFIKTMKFDRMGVFPYSPEPGTPAARMADQIPFEVAEARAAKLMAYQRKAMARANKKLVGTELEVTVDCIEGDFAVCRGNADAPDIDNVVYVDIARRRVSEGDRLRVEVAGTSKSDLVAIIKKGKKK